MKGLQTEHFAKAIDVAKKAIEDARSKGFVQGCALAVATLIRLHGEGVEARDLCRELSVNSIKTLKENDVDEYDMEVLEPFIEKDFVERLARYNNHPL